MYDELDPPDYRDSQEAKELLARIESIVEKKKSVRPRFINEQIEMPRGWNLIDVIAMSDKIVFEDAFRPMIVLKRAVKGIPDADAFNVAKASDMTVANLGL